MRRHHLLKHFLPLLFATSLMTVQATQSSSSSQDKKQVKVTPLTLKHLNKKAG